MKTVLLSLLLPISFSFMGVVYANTPPGKDAGQNNTTSAKYLLASNESGASYELRSEMRPDEPPKVNVKKPTQVNRNSTDRVVSEPSQMSNNFVANKGNLKWPVSSGYMTVPYGKYTHHHHSKVSLNNYGIDISAKEGSNILSVYHGSVCRIQQIDNNYTVIVNHGEYYTVYSYLSSVAVKLGDVVTPNQKLGVIGKNDEGRAMLHFEVCRLNENNQIVTEDPSLWIVNQ